MRHVNLVPDPATPDASDDENADRTASVPRILSDVEGVPLPRLPGDDDLSIDTETLPDDLPGLADATDEDLTSLFDDASRRHMTDGFTGSGDEDGENISQNDGDDTPDLPEHPPGA